MKKQKKQTKLHRQKTAWWLPERRGVVKGKGGQKHSGGRRLDFE